MIDRAHVDEESAERFALICRLTADLFANMPRPQRDRMFQSHLAAARGPKRNGDLLRSMTARLFPSRGTGIPSGESIMIDPIIEALQPVGEVLESGKLVYAVTGSVASSVHGEPYASTDVDVVLHATPMQAAAVARKLMGRFYADEEMLAEAAQRQSLANIVDNRTGYKVDLSFVPATGYFGEALARRVWKQIGSSGPEFPILSPEDVILMKLLWIKEGGGPKQWLNAMGVVRVQGLRLDWQYLFRQASILGVEPNLIKLRDEAGL